MADSSLAVVPPVDRHPRLRAWAVRILVCAPGVAIVLLDYVRRHDRIASYAGRDLALYLMSALLSAILWGSLVAAASQRSGWERWIARGLLVIGAGLAVGAQVYFFHRYQAYLNHRAVLVGTSMLPSIGQQLWGDRVNFIRAVLPPVAIAAVLPLVIARLAPVARSSSRFALDLGLIALLVAVFYAKPTRGGEQGATPDVLYLSSMGELARARWQKSPEVLRVHPGPRTPLAMPPLDARPPYPRNVVLIVDESVRAMDICTTYDPECTVTPFTNEAAKRRFGFSQMRSLDSTTAVSLAVMWAGLPATATREEFHTAPLLWEYAHAAGFDTAYWTAQHPFFANAGLWLDGLPLTKYVSATQIDEDATYELGADDGKLIDAAIRDLRALKEPFVGVVHLSNTHFPYKIDPDDAPFQPESEAVGPGDGPEVHNRYRDAIYLQDKHVARLLETLRATPAGARTVVLFMSDHGEQIRERGAIGHTTAVHDEEIRIGAWLDAPPGTLTASEEASLRAIEKTPLTALDVLPTILDLMGVWDSPKIAALRAKMPGASLLRGGSSPELGVVLTNCTEIFACAFKNWGAMRGTKKLLASQDDFQWRCYDVIEDPEEETDLGEDGCPGLKELAEGGGRGAPF